MNLPANTIGQAVFIRTGVLDYAEVNLPFQTLEELVKVCSEPQPGLTLERVVVFSLRAGQPCALTLGFISASRGLRGCDAPSQQGERDDSSLAPASDRTVAPLRACGQGPQPLVGDGASPPRATGSGGIVPR